MKLFSDQVNKLKIAGELYDDIISQSTNMRSLYVFCRYCVLQAILNLINFPIYEIKSIIELCLDDNNESTELLINACKLDADRRIVDLFDCATFQENIKDGIDLLYSICEPPETVDKNAHEITSQIIKKYLAEFPSDLLNYPLLTENQIISTLNYEAFCIEDAISLFKSMENADDPFSREALVNLKARQFEEKIEKFTYSRRRIMTLNEIENYKHLRNMISSDYYLFPQISLLSIIEKRFFDYKAYSIGDQVRTIDFGIFDKDCNVKLLIEINDKSHRNESRRLRDLHVQTILKKADIKLVTLKPFDYRNKKLLTQMLGDFAK